MPLYYKPTRGAWQRVLFFRLYCTRDVGGAADAQICVLILLCSNMCPHTTICVRMLLFIVSSCIVQERGSVLHIQ
jgi:hypothetical protein